MAALTVFDRKKGALTAIYGKLAALTTFNRKNRGINGVQLKKALTAFYQKNSGVNGSQPEE